MNTDVAGCSTCQKGEEHFETFYVRGKPRIQYDYRTPGGELFSTVATSLTQARAKRDEWLKEGR